METNSNTTESEHQIVNRIAKAWRLRDLLAGIGVTSKADVAEWGEGDWEQVCRVDYDRRQAESPSTTRFKAPSASTVAATIALLADDGEADESDPFAGLS